MPATCRFTCRLHTVVVAARRYSLSLFIYFVFGPTNDWAGATFDLNAHNCTGAPTFAGCFNCTSGKARACYGVTGDQVLRTLHLQFSVFDALDSVTRTDYFMYIALIGVVFKVPPARACQPIAAATRRGRTQRPKRILPPPTLPHFRLTTPPSYGSSRTSRSISTPARSPRYRVPPRRPPTESSTPMRWNWPSGPPKSFSPPGTPPALPTPHARSTTCG